MDELKLFSTVLMDVKRRLLFRGLCFGGCGIGVILFFGVWATPLFLSKWGLLIFCATLILISVGLIPYKNLTRLETRPHQILINEKELIFISSKGSHKSIPLSSIKAISFWKLKTKYGLMLDLENTKAFLPCFLSDPRLNEIVHPNESD